MGVLYCCSNFGYQKSLDKKGGYQNFTSKIFCLTVAKNSVGESFTVASISGPEKVWIRGGRGEYQCLLSKFFCLTVPKISAGESFIAALISGTEKVWIRSGGVSRFSVEKFLSHSAEIFRRGVLYCCSTFGYRRCLEKRGGGIKVLRRKFFVSQCRNFT